MFTSFKIQNNFIVLPRVIGFKEYDRIQVAAQ